MRQFTYQDTLRASYLGYITQAIINNFAPLLFLIFRDSFNIPLEQITLLITVNFLTQLVVDMLAIKYVDRIGYKVSIVAAHVFAAVGILGLGIFPMLTELKFLALLAAVMTYAVGGGLIEVLISPIVEATPTENKSASMSVLHSFYCWGVVMVVVCSTLFLHVFGTQSWSILTGIWALFALGNAFYYSQVPITMLTEEGESMTVKTLFSMKTFWLFIILMISAGASEHAMAQWSSAFVESGLGLSKTMGDLMGPTIFAILMGVARVFYAKYSEQINLLTFITGSGLLCIASYLLVIFAPNVTLSLIGSALCGLSVGILWPGIFSIAAQSIPKGGTAMFAILALAGDLGCAAGPSIVGGVSGLFNENLKYGFMVAIIFPVTIVSFSLIYRYRQHLLTLLVRI